MTVNGKRSKKTNVISGIPQGSVLGPLLFVIYINILPSKIESATYMFTDDTKIYRQIKEEEEDKQALPQDIDQLLGWSDQ